MPDRSFSDLNVTIDFSSVPLDAPVTPYCPMIVSRVVLVTSNFTSANWFGFETDPNPPLPKPAALSIRS